MSFKQIFPSKRGGAYKPSKPTAKLTDDGVLILSVAAMAMIGNPARVHVWIDEELKAFRLQATGIGDFSGWRVSGNGAAPYRVSLRTPTKGKPELFGEYDVVEVNAGILELVKKIGT